MSKRKRPAPWRIRRPSSRRLARAMAAFWLATIPGVTPTHVAANEAEAPRIATPRDPKDGNGNGIPDVYELVPYTGFTVIRGSPPPDVVLSVHPLPVLPGRAVNVAVLHGGSTHVQRVRVEPDIGVPLMVDRPVATNGLTLVPFYIAEEAGGDSLRVTVLLEDIVLARSVPIETYPEFGEYVYVEELPEAVSKTAPVYPDEARHARVDGTVMVQALVGTDGRVWDTRIVKSVPGLDEASEACVRQWRFKPALAGGKPVAVWVAVPVRYSLH